ncbi:MAG: hypothetical protein ACRDTD_25465, partial [Pseudonocardiaceae bacterium]
MRGSQLLPGLGHSAQILIGLRHSGVRRRLVTLPGVYLRLGLTHPDASVLHLAANETPREFIEQALRNGTVITDDMATVS